MVAAAPRGMSAARAIRAVAHAAWYETGGGVSHSDGVVRRHVDQVSNAIKLVSDKGKMRLSKDNQDC